MCKAKQTLNCSVERGAWDRNSLQARGAQREVGQLDRVRRVQAAGRKEQGSKQASIRTENQSHHLFRAEMTLGCCASGFVELKPEMAITFQGCFPNYEGLAPLSNQSVFSAHWALTTPHTSGAQIPAPADFPCLSPIAPQDELLPSQGLLQTYLTSNSYSSLKPRLRSHHLWKAFPYCPRKSILFAYRLAQGQYEPRSSTHRRCPVTAGLLLLDLVNAG